VRRRPTPLDAAAIAAAVESARRRLDAAYALCVVLQAGRRAPRGLAATLTPTTAGRADLYRVIRAMHPAAPIARPSVVDDMALRYRPTTAEDFRKLVESLRVAHDLAETADARTATTNARGIATARYLRALGNEGI
jgi:hypothetical protein